MRGKNLEIMLSASVMLISLVICAPCKGKIIYVDSGAPGANDGSSWADAYNYLQDALVDVNTAEKPVEILVAQGIYKPDQGVAMTLGDRSESFQLINGVSIFGGYAGFGDADPDTRDFELYETTLSGDLNDDDIEVISSDDLAGEPGRAENSYQVVTGSGTDETAVLDGFTITGGNANVFTNRNGGGLLNEYGAPQIINCTFSENSAQYYGGAIYNYYSSPILVNCTFILNSAGTDGGGIYNYRGDTNLDNCTFIDNRSGSTGGGISRNGGSSIITNCTFIDNRANYAGGGTYCSGNSLIINNSSFTGNWAENRGGGIYCSVVNSSLTNCIFSNNSADYGGGGICFNNSDPNLTGCSFSENSASYGGGMYNDRSNLNLSNCKFIENSGYDYGGAMCNMSSNTLSLNNCIIIANRANSYGGGMYNNTSELTFTNCTFTGNSAREGSTFAFNSPNGWFQSTAGLIDCILWDYGNIMWINDRSTMAISYSNIRGGWSGAGNIDTNPLFADPNGPDNIPGTEDDDLRLAPLSPCIDSGDPNYMSGPNDIDLDGNPRVVSGRVDIGAYEFPGIIYVDNQTPEDPDQDLQENGTEAHPFDIIQEGINVAKDSQTILVRPGVYPKIDFMGKAITVAGTEGAAVIEAWSVGGRTAVQKEDAVTFHTGEGPGSVLKNFIIKNSGMAISLNYGSSPTITNLTIVDNDFGIAAYENSNPGISNCILWNNRDGDLFQCEVRYSCLEGDVPGRGNICVNPLFVDAVGGDYHLKSQGWRWNIDSETWTYDNVTSPCIDAGDPASLLGDEPLSVPRDPNNEYGVNLRINMGAYGGTAQASIPPLGWSEEISAE